MAETVTLASKEQPQWTLRRAVLVYETERMIDIGDGRPFGPESRVYATVHKVRNGRRGPELEAGVPATREACADLARALGANATLGGFLPPSLLYLGAKSLMWWRPPGLTRVFFDTTKQAAGDQFFDAKGAALIGKKNGVTWHPGLVFAVAGGRWYVYALADERRPEPGAALYRAPYFNVWASGQICTGNVRLPDKLTPQALATYERAFFDSEFTHSNCRGREKLVHDDPYELWKLMLGMGKSAPGFPTPKLVNIKLTLEGLAKRLEKGGRVTADD